MNELRRALSLKIKAFFEGERYQLVRSRVDLDIEIIIEIYKNAWPKLAGAHTSTQKSNK